jgi:chitinase
MANSTASFQPKVPISTIRSEYPNAKVMIAVGGWGDDIGFYQASKSAAAIKQFAADVSTMLTNTGADGVGMSSISSQVLAHCRWPYSRHRLGISWWQWWRLQASSKLGEELFLAATRAAIGDKILSIAVPGKQGKFHYQPKGYLVTDWKYIGDMIAYTKENGPKIWPSVDYINVSSPAHQSEWLSAC